MKKIALLFYSFIVINIAFAQSNEINPLEKFNVLSATAESTGLHSGKLDSSTCVQMLRIAQALKNDSLLAISYNLIGEYVSREKGDNTAGLEYYFKAIPLAEKAHDKRRLSSIYFDMALIYFNLQNNEESVKAIRKGGENLPDKSHPMYDFMLAQYQRGMSIYFVFDKKPDSALAYAQQLMLTSRKIKSPLFEFSAGYLNGAAYAEQGEKDLAETWFKEGAALSDSLNSPYAVLRFAAIYIPFLISNHRLIDANMQAQHLLSVGEQLGNNDLKLLGAGFMRQLFDSSHNIDSAYYYSRMEAVANSEIFNQNSSNKIQALAFNEQIRQIDEESKAKQLEEERQQNIQFALIALGIIIFITLFLLLSRTVIVNERLISFFAILGLLVVFEFINLLIHPWLAHFTHESPVLMLLALVLIASLLIPLHHKLEHWIKEKMIEKNKAIRLAAAKKTIEKLEKKSGED